MTHTTLAGSALRRAIASRWPAESRRSRSSNWSTTSRVGVVGTFMAAMSPGPIRIGFRWCRAPPGPVSRPISPAANSEVLPDPDSPSRNTTRAASSCVGRRQASTSLRSDCSRPKYRFACSGVYGPSPAYGVSAMVRVVRRAAMVASHCASASSSAVRPRWPSSSRNFGVSAWVGRCLPSNHPCTVEAGSATSVEARRMEMPCALRALASSATNSSREPGDCMKAANHPCRFRTARGHQVAVTRTDSYTVRLDVGSVRAYRGVVLRPG